MHQRACGLSHSVVVMTQICISVLVVYLHFVAWRVGDFLLNLHLEWHLHLDPLISSHLFSDLLFDLDRSVDIHLHLNCDRNFYVSEHFNRRRHVHFDRFVNHLLLVDLVRYLYDDRVGHHLVVFDEVGDVDVYCIHVGLGNFDPDHGLDDLGHFDILDVRVLFGNLSLLCHLDRLEFRGANTVRLATVAVVLADTTTLLLEAPTFVDCLLGYQFGLHVSLGHHADCKFFHLFLFVLDFLFLYLLPDHLDLLDFALLRLDHRFHHFFLPLLPLNLSPHHFLRNCDCFLDSLCFFLHDSFFLLDLLGMILNHLLRLRHLFHDCLRDCSHLRFQHCLFLLFCSHLPYGLFHGANRKAEKDSAETE